jgi:hypothetical protein
MQTSVQDWPGRTGLWHVGVPPSGPMDALSFRLANALVGNDTDAAGEHSCPAALPGSADAQLPVGLLPAGRDPAAGWIPDDPAAQPEMLCTQPPAAPHAPPPPAGLEFSLSGPTLKFHCDTLVALCGATFNAKLDGEPVASWASFAVKGGQTLAIGAIDNSKPGVGGGM